MKNEEATEDIICPICGYYCLGNGGYGCIDKPTLCGININDNRPPDEKGL